MAGLTGSPATATTRPPRGGPMHRHCTALRNLGSLWNAACVISTPFFPSQTISLTAMMARRGGYSPIERFPLQRHGDGSGAMGDRDGTADEPAGQHNTTAVGGKEVQRGFW